MAHTIFNDRDLEQRVTVVEKELHALHQKRMEVRKSLSNLDRQITKAEKKLVGLKSDLMD